MSTPHIAAKKDEIAKTVLMSGDPLRVKLMAEKYLKDCKLVSYVRALPIYTGTYNGKKITIMGHGMGMISMGIYLWELFNEYGVETIMRVGSAGSYHKDLGLGEIVVAEAARTDSNFGEAFGITDREIGASKIYLDQIKKEYGSRNDIRFGKIFSSNWFYRLVDKDAWKKEAALGTLCVENEAYGLFSTAKALNKNALTILTMSDNLVTHELMSPEERLNSFSKMYEFALDVATKIVK